MKGLGKSVPLAPLTTFKIGGPARYFLKVGNISELKEAIKWAKKKKLSSFILGGGSNILVSDKGFDGLIIRIQNTKYKIQNTKIVAGAGMPLGKLIDLSIKNKFTGLEWAAGIPGTIAGAIRGNAGAHGRSISELAESIKVLRAGKVITLKNKEAGFSYRKSVFQKNKDIISEVTLVLKKGNPRESKKMVKDFLRRRILTQPARPSAGCVFKNPRFSSVAKKKLEKNPEMKQFKEGGQVPAGWLIEKCGLKGARVGGAGISLKHANFIVNLGGAKAGDVTRLINLIKQKIRNKFRLELVEEIEYVGFDR